MYRRIALPTVLLLCGLCLIYCQAIAEPEENGKQSWSSVKSLYSPEDEVDEVYLQLRRAYEADPDNVIWRHPMLSSIGEAGGVGDRWHIDEHYIYRALGYMEIHLGSGGHYLCFAIIYEDWLDPGSIYIDNCS